ncbi:hypothetical protein [Brachybacterium vulturis]|uniref:hypothetical protein n=1 Tax=Brachybacterium vulturis TaxID=2017484 RepID=UPI0037353DD0
MRLVRAIRSAPVYWLLKLAVVIYFFMWFSEMNDIEPSPHTAQNVAVAAVAVIAWGRLRNLLIRIYPLRGESIAEDKWILQLYPRALACGIIWIAMSAQSVELDSSFLIALFATFVLLLVRPVPLINMPLGLIAAALGLILMFVGESYIHPTDTDLVITGLLLTLLGLEAAFDSLVHVTGRDRRIESRETKALKGEKVREARRKRWEGKTPAAVMDEQIYMDWEAYQMDVERNDPDAHSKNLLRELQTHLGARRLSEAAKASGVYPGDDFPIDAIPLSDQRTLHKSMMARRNHSDPVAPRLVTNADGGIVGGSGGVTWIGYGHWSLDELEDWKRSWLEQEAAQG